MINIRYITGNYKPRKLLKEVKNGFIIFTEDSRSNFSTKGVLVTFDIPAEGTDAIEKLEEIKIPCTKDGAYTVIFKASLQCYTENDYIFHYDYDKCYSRTGDEDDLYSSEDYVYDSLTILYKNFITDLAYQLMEDFGKIHTENLGVTHMRFNYAYGHEYLEHIQFCILDEDETTLNDKEIEGSVGCLFLNIIRGSVPIEFVEYTVDELKCLVNC